MPDAAVTISDARARTRPNVALSLLDDDHQISAGLPGIWNDIEASLGLIE
jgi:hypothetical protein